MRPLITALAAVHLAITLWHSEAHTELGIGLPAWKLAYAYAVIVIAPPVAAALLWTRFASWALWLFTAAMVGSLLFATYHHYILVSPDNIAHLPEGAPEAQVRFVVSAGWSALLELASALVGAFYLGRGA
ncbi:MAG TPA: hypothetical protein VMR86_15040 [Myxococcota bacterium]|nr:hypothetical protein [Myxococcota bacterium]